MHVLGSVPVGEPQSENEFRAAIFSLPDQRLSQLAHSVPWPQYRLLLISPLCTCLHSSSYWIEVPAHVLWPLSSINLAFMNVNKYLVLTAPSAQGDGSMKDIYI